MSTTPTPTPRQRLGARKKKQDQAPAPTTTGATAAARPVPELVMPAPKARRRPLLAVGAVALMALGALLGLFTLHAVSSAQSVLAVRQDITRGKVISASDLMQVSIGVDPALHPIAAGNAGSVIGKTAAMDMPSGSLVTAADLTTANVPAAGNSLVGISLPGGMLPGGGSIRVGDTVRVVLTPGPSSAGNSAATPQGDPITATVRGITTITGSTTSSSMLNLEVPTAQAPQLAAWASTTRAAVVLESAGH